MAGGVARHRESQGLASQPIAVVALGLSGVAIAVALVLDPPDGTGEWVGAVVAAVLVAWLFTWQLVLEVTSEEIRISLGGVFRRRIPLADVAEVEVTHYHPLKKFGGWGWRWGRGGARQYAMAGDRAVRVVLADDREVFLGSDKPTYLADAIEQARADRG